MIPLKGIPITKTKDFARHANIYKAVVTIGAEIPVDFNWPHDDESKIQSELEFMLRRKLYFEIKLAVEKLEVAARKHARWSFVAHDEVIGLASEIYNLMEQ